VPAEPKGIRTANGPAATGAGQKRPARTTHSRPGPAHLPKPTSEGSVHKMHALKEENPIWLEETLCRGGTRTGFSHLQIKGSRGNLPDPARSGGESVHVVHTLNLRPLNNQLESFKSGRRTAAVTLL
jgi:hypothetical protein